MQFTNAQTDIFYGLGVLGSMKPSRAETVFEWNYETSEMEEMPGWFKCLTEVVPWPFSEDEEGIPFDQANLYGVRTRVWRQPLLDGGGDMEWWTAVPKTLPAEYTAVGRCHIGYARVADYIGGDPMNGFSWNHRTPTGFLLNTTTDPDGHRGQWCPMNLNQEALGASVSDIFSGQWVYYVEAGSGDILYVVALLANSHIGFRGGKLTWTKTNEFPSGFVSGSNTYEICAVPVNEYWDPSDAGDDSMVHVLTSGSVTWAFTGVSDPPIVIDDDLGDMRPPNPGIRYNFFIRYPYNDSDGSLGAVYRSSHAIRLGPRTDVPLPWFSSQRNRVAPGGIIEPP